MKNFFKKLSFVLAIAMVLTSLAPATASAAAKNYVAVNGKKATATYAYIGGKEVVLTPYVNGKKATKVTIENSNPEKATIDNNGVITPVANGNTIVTFKKGDKKIGTVTVKVRTRAKALNIYDRAEYKAGNKTKLTELTLKVGDKKDLQITMPLYKVSKKAGAVKASYFTYPEVSDSSVVKVTKNAGQRNFTVEALAAGTAKVTIVANQKTEKNVRADKYYKEASFNVTVKDEKLTAEQAGNKVIKVTGTDLTDKVADYVVKKGNATLSVKVAYVKEGDTSAVNITFPTKLGKNEYTVKFKDGDAVTVATEEEDIANIEFLYDAVVAKTLVAGACTDAEAFYKVTNQWEEDITASVTISNTAGSSLMVSGGPGTLTADNKTGKVSIAAIPAGSGIVGVSQFTLTIVCTTNGKSATKTMTLAKEGEASDIEILGVYKNTASGLVAADPVVGDTISEYYLLLSVKDQYGRPVTTATDLNVPANGFFTLGVATTKKLDGVTYLAFPISSVDIAGTAKVFAVSTKNGKSATKEITVLNPVQIKTFTAKPVDSVLYSGVKAEFEFEATDSEGKAVTAYSALKPVMTSGTSATNMLPSGFTWERQADGSAKLFYTPSFTGSSLTNLKEYTMTALSFKTPLYGFSNVTVTVYEAPVVQGILGLASSAKTAMLAGREAGLKVSDFRFYDQYNNEIGVDTVVSQNPTIVVVSSAAVEAFTSIGDATVSASSKDNYVVTGSSITGKKGSQYVTVKLSGIDNSDYTVEFTSASLDQVTGLEVGALKKYFVDNTSNVPTANVSVTGYVGDAKISLVGGVDFAVVTNNDSTGTHVIIPATQALSVGLKEGELEFEVQVFNTAKTTLKGKVAYSNAAAVLSTVGVYTKTTVATQSTINGTVNLTTGTSIVAGGFMGVEDAANAAAASVTPAENTKIIYAFDQYSNALDIANYYSTTRYNVSVVDADADGNNVKCGLTISKNNSSLTSVAVTGNAGDQFILHIDYTFANGLTASADVLYEVK